MEEIIHTFKLYLLYFAFFLFFVMIYKKKIESIILDRQIYILELQKKELQRKNQILKTEIAKRKTNSKDSLLYYWKIYNSLPNYEDHKIFKIIIEKE
ncbi:MAG: hypothetical protein ACK4UJ_01315 [Leptonema sp. (in: bacteria)]